MSRDLPEEGAIAYFAYQRQGATYLGALVVVSLEGDPLDFAYTDPVTLNSFSLRLLGSRADGYMVSRILLEPLLRQVKTPLFVCFDDAQVLHRRLRLAQPGVVFADAGLPHKEGHWVPHALKDGPNTTLHCWITYNADKGLLGRIRQAAEAMAPFDITEPFKQLRAAMAEMHGQGSQ